MTRVNINRRNCKCKKCCGETWLWAACFIFLKENRSIEQYKKKLFLVMLLNGMSIGITLHLLLLTTFSLVGLNYAIIESLKCYRLCVEEYDICVNSLTDFSKFSKCTNSKIDCMKKCKTVAGQAVAVIILKDQTMPSLEGEWNNRMKKASEATYGTYLCRKLCEVLHHHSVRDKCLAKCK